MAPDAQEPEVGEVVVVPCGDVVHVAPDVRASVAKFVLVLAAGEAFTLRGASDDLLASLLPVTRQALLAITVRPRAAVATSHNDQLLIRMSARTS
ncbi:hypothetical protein [Nocardiopsis sp. NPDC058789]|uniref:hypothetical protein n=1 Tax=Nocardiopsis sp. NPDC058789 TaxID=3346634 RepID=UPI00366D785D